MEEANLLSQRPIGGHKSSEEDALSGSARLQLYRAQIELGAAEWDLESLNDDECGIGGFRLKHSEVNSQTAPIPSEYAKLK